MTVARNFQFSIIYRILIIIILSGFYLVGFSQEGEHKLTWTKNKKSSRIVDGKRETESYLHFKGAIYEDISNIPVFIKAFTLPASQSVNTEFVITNLKYEAIPDSLLDEVILPDIIDQKSSAVVYKGGSNYYLDVKINAVRINKMTNHAERLLSFSLEKKILPKDIDREDNQMVKSTNSSLLASGTWFKFKVNETAIYKLSYNDITDIGFSNPENIRVYGHGGKQLSFYNGDPRPTDLVEIPLYMEKGSDNNFGEGDFILFYAEGPKTWEYEEEAKIFKQKLHNYSLDISYFLTTSKGPATQIIEKPLLSGAADIEVNTYTDYDNYEIDAYNIIGSGRNWYSTAFDENSYSQTFSFPGKTNNGTFKVEASVVARSQIANTAKLFINGSEKDAIILGSVSYKHSYTLWGKSGKLQYSGAISGTSAEIGLEYYQSIASDKAYIDYVTVNAECDLKKLDKPFFFRNPEFLGTDQIAQYSIAGTGSNDMVWDVSTINNIQALNSSISGGNLLFKDSVNVLKEYALIDLSYDYSKPIISEETNGVGFIDNQNIRALSLVNYLIISHEGFVNQAERLADYHQTNSGLSVAIVTPEQIYNEFSSGTPDVTALRDFIRQHYKKSSASDSLKYVLLLGDGSYNNHMYEKGNPNYILTYQSANSLTPSESYSADDFFGLLDDTEGGTDAEDRLIGKLDIGVGRIPVGLVDNSDSQAAGVIDKILGYHENTYSEWRRILCFVGDDNHDAGGTDNERNQHMEAADHMTKIVANTYTGFEAKKIYLDAYKQVATSTGAFYPEAKEELMNTINQGALLVTYFGHGSENQLTSERVLQKSDVKSLKNKFLPVLITATCQFSRYDDVDMTSEANQISPRTSAGEETLLNSKGGAVSLLSTSRVVYGAQNENLAAAVYNCIFKLDYKGNRYRLGDVVKIAKNKVGDERNKLNFSLLGDPALMLAFPEFNVITDSLNGKAVNEAIDTLKAFSKVTISGYVADKDSSIISDFNGLVYPRIYDKEFEVITLANDPGVDTFIYMDQSNLIYRGKATVKDGRFDFTFIVPKDISYNLGNAKISYYAENTVIDARGEFRDVLLGGTADDIELDYSGPEIELFMNDESFIDGGITNSEPYLYALLSDENGINTTGIGIGHNIVGTLDNEKQYLLNDYYEANVDDYTSGSVKYQLYDLEEGEYYLSLKAWDIFNNSSEEYISFVVKDINNLTVEKLVNYPNPATSQTTFQYSHNAPDQDHEITLDIFDLSGRKVSSIKRKIYETGFISQPLVWDLNGGSGSGLGPGIYPYRLIIKTENATTQVNQKLIIIK